ncbi:hypothetical protein KC331_g7012 [Hortaea werneckii]|nr:hypothetical protein KC331_g7012 [Hortaea werneckii]
MLNLIIALLLHQVTSSDFQCPASNNLVVQDDYGVQYIVSCGTDADPGSYAGSSVFNNWNECFQACSTHSIDANGAGGPCNGFTYVGALNGRGGGSCYFKSGNMRFVGSGSSLISVATPERCPGCNIAGYANGTSPRSSSAAGLQTVSVTYTTIQTRTETATRYSTNTITTTGTVTTTAVSSYYTTAITTAVSISRETLTTTTVQTTIQPASTVTSVSTYSTTTVVTYTSVVPASTQTNTRTQTQLTTVTYVSTQPTTVVSTYVSTQPASTNTATITQRTTVVSTYLTTSVVTQTQTSTAPGTTFTTTSVFTSTYPVTATETTSFYTTSTAVSTYRTTATVTSVQPTTVLSTYVETVTSVQPASTIERTQTQQTTIRETSVAPGPTQTVTSTQLTTYVSTFTTSYPYTTTLPGATATTVSWATSTMRTTIVSTLTTTIQETLTQPGTTIQETTTQPGVTVISTLDRTVSGPTATYTTVSISYGEGSVIYVTQTVFSPSSTSSSAPFCSSQPTSCPAVDEQTIVDCASGSQYYINCDISYEGIVLESVTASDLLSCLDLCSPVFNCQAVAYNIETQICSQYEELFGNPLYSPNSQIATLTQRLNADDGAFGAESISEPDPTSVSSDMSPSEATQSSQFSGEQSFAPTIASSTSVLEPSSISSETSASAFVQSGQMSSDSAFTQITNGERTSSSIFGAPSSTFSFATSVSSSLTIVTATSSTAPTETPSTSSASSGVPSGSASSSWSTSESPLPTATGIPSCSTQGEQSTYTDPSTGSVYVVQCNKEYQGVVERSIYKPDVEQCVTDCSTNARCIGVGYGTQEEICNEYSAFAPTSGNYSEKVVFAKMRARAVVYDGGSTTTVPISTSYVPLTAVTTPLPPSMAGSTSVSILSTSLSSSSSFSSTSASEAVLTSSTTSNVGTRQPASSLTTPAATKTLSESYSSNSDIQTPYGPTNSLDATQHANSETTFSTWTTARTTSEITPRSSSNVSGASSQTGATMLSSTNTGLVSQSVSASELSLISSPTSPSSANSAAATSPSFQTSSTNDAATTSLTVASPTRTLEPSATVCPGYDGTAAVDENGVVYYVQCGVAYNGTVINPSSQKRQAVTGYTMLQCTDMCDQNEDCVGLTLGSDGRCTQYSYVSGYLPDQAPVAAVPLSRAPSLPTEISVAATSTNPPSSSFTSDVTSSQAGTSSIRASTGVDVANISSAQASTGTHTSSARASTDNDSTVSPAQASTRTSGINTSTFSNLTRSPAAPTKSTSPPPIVTIFVTPSTCTASHSVHFSTTTTYTTVTVGAPS